MPFFTLKDGTKLFYKEEGSGSPPLVLVHGWTCSSWYWLNQVPYFSKFNRVITPGLKGHGSSDKPQGHYSPSEYAKELDQLFDKLLGKEKFVLCGHSMGGFIALAYATDPVFSKRLKGVILCNTAHAVKGNPVMKSMVDSTKKGTLGYRRPFEDLFTKMAFNTKFIREHKDVVQSWVDEAMKCPDHVMVGCAQSWVDDYDLTDKLSQISAPVLIITSDIDSVIDPKHSSYMKEHVNNSQLVVLNPAIGHFTPLEAADEFNKAVKSFIDKLK